MSPARMLFVFCYAESWGLVFADACVSDRPLEPCRVDAYNTTHLDTIFNKLQAGLVTALNNLDWTGLKPPPGPPVEAAYQGEGIQKLFCGDGSVASRSEECDQGEALNGDQFECGSECRCTPGHIAIDGICTCDSTVRCSWPQACLCGLHALLRRC
eukprot:1646381-Rhodomonas_salina.1